MNMRKKLFTGLHILEGIITNNPRKLRSLSTGKRYICKVIKDYRLHEINSFYYKLPKNYDFASIIILAESHVSILLKEKVASSSPARGISKNFQAFKKNFYDYKIDKIS